jgi:hypothetical protein
MGQKETHAPQQTQCRVGTIYSIKPSACLPLRARREDVILCRDRRMARVTARGAAWRKVRGLKRVGRRIVSKLGVRPAVGIRESLRILFD